MEFILFPLLSGTNYAEKVFDGKRTEYVANIIFS